MTRLSHFLHEIFGLWLLLRNPGFILDPLIGHVEEAEELPLLDDGRELLPLLRLRVHARRVVRARVQQDYAPLGNFLEEGKSVNWSILISGQPNTVRFGFG